jgi:heme exporter protein A
MRLTGSELAVARGGRRIFEGVSFSLSAGEMVTVTGPNGVGKSTLLRLVAGLLRPEAGRIAIDPEPADGAPIVHYLGHLDALKPSLTVRENLDFWRRLWVGAGDVEEALETVGLGGRDHLPAAVLSAGQKRRVALARLLVAARPLWLLDEPATALDSDGEAMLGRLMQRHLFAGGLVMAATHRSLPLTPTAAIALGPPVGQPPDRPS